MLSPDFADALQYAALLHASQMRKASPGEETETRVPYVSHLLAVAALVIEHGGTEDEAIGALLHDAIEDQAENLGRDPEGLAGRIERRFGPKVLAIVRGCSDSDGVEKAPWVERKRAYIEHIRHAESSVLLVSASDKVHNSSSILKDAQRFGDRVWTRFSAPEPKPCHIAGYYRGLLDAYRAGFKRHGMNEFLLDELELNVVALEKLAGIA